MHPVIAQFLDPQAVRATLEKSARGEVLTEPELLFAAAASAHPERKARALEAKSTEDQQAALALSVFAALTLVERDPTLGPEVQKARAKLVELGANPEEVQQFLSLVLLEEAFGFDDDGESFNAELVAETYRTLPRIAGLDAEAVEALEEGFAQAAPPPARPIQLAASNALFTAAWSDGPVPVSPDHVEEAIEKLRDGASEPDFAATVRALEALLQLLAREGLIGLGRLKHLLETAKFTALAFTTGEGDDGLDEEVEDEDEDFGDDEPTDSGEGSRN